MSPANNENWPYVTESSVLSAHLSGSVVCRESSLTISGGTQKCPAVFGTGVMETG